MCKYFILYYHCICFIYQDNRYKRRVIHYTSYSYFTIFTNLSIKLPRIICTYRFRSPPTTADGSRQIDPFCLSADICDSATIAV